jgi:hypothetical protein
VRELDARLAALGVQEVDHACQAGHVVVGPEAHVAVADPPLGRHPGRLDDDQAEAAQREAAEVGQVVVADEAVGDRVLAHRCDDQTVGQGQAAEGQGREEGGRSHGRTPTPPRAWLFRVTRQGLPTRFRDVLDVTSLTVTDV